MPNSKKPQQPFSYGKYMNMAGQMAVTICLGVFGGIKLDAYLGFKKIPVFTLVLSLASVAIAIYLVIKDFLKK